MGASRLVFVSYFGPFYLIPAVEFAKLLINHRNGLTITFFIIPPYGNSPSRTNVESFVSSHSYIHGLHFIILPPHLTISHSLHPSALQESLIENQKLNVKDAVSWLNSDPDPPLLAAFFVDMSCIAMIDVATDFNVPSFLLFPYSAAFLGFQLHTLSLKERGERDPTAFNLEDSGVEYDMPTFTNLLPVGAFPYLTKDSQWKQVFLNRMGRMKKANAIIVNTFLDLESHVLRSLDPNVYPVGPLSIVKEDRYKKFAEGSWLKKWLDDQPPCSVLFLCLRIYDYLKRVDQVREIAMALARSEVRFLWSLPKQSTCDYTQLEVELLLPEVFLWRMGENGTVVGLANEAQILAHEAVGGFVSNCRWDSIMESVYNGVPIATWPHVAEEHLNAFLLVRELKMGVEISLDYREEVGMVISAERIEKGIREVMEEESEVRNKVKVMSELSRRALMEGGSSRYYLERFLKERLNNEE